MTATKLKKAIQRGEKRAAKETAQKAAEAAAERERILVIHKQNVVQQRERLLRDNYLFGLIEEAVAQGKSLVSLRVGASAAEAINTTPEFEGLRAKYEEGWDHINSDEVKEFWCRVDVTWEK